jgi:hypothetical protein
MLPNLDHQPMKPAFIKRAIVVMVCLAFCNCCVLARAAETLPAPVSDLVRELGELRDTAWGLLEEARKVYATNEAALTSLNVQYIEASAAANSLIEQLQLETAAHTTLEAKRYEPTVTKARNKCQAFTNEWHKLMFTTVKTRGATTTGSTTTTSSSASSSSAGSSSSSGASFDYAAKAVTIADGLLGVLAKNKKTFRDLDAQQRVEVRNLLEERKWKPLQTGTEKNQAAPQTDAAPRTPKKPTAGQGAPANPTAE